MLSDKFTAIEEDRGERFFKEKYQAAQTLYEANLNPRFKAREYQEEALGRLEHYLSGYGGRKRPTHLLFEMATGAGKRTGRGGARLGLYTWGYGTLFFFVRRVGI